MLRGRTRTPPVGAALISSEEVLVRARDTSQTQPTTNRAARRAAARGKTPQGAGPDAPRTLDRIGRASTTPVHFRTDYAARRSG
jgi:hypothetical protein